MSCGDCDLAKTYEKNGGMVKSYSWLRLDPVPIIIRASNSALYGKLKNRSGRERCMLIAFHKEARCGWATYAMPRSEAIQSYRHVRYVSQRIAASTRSSSYLGEGFMNF